MISRLHAARVERIARQRGKLDLAAQVAYQCELLALLRTLAADKQDHACAELLRDPVKLAMRMRSL